MRRGTREGKGTVGPCETHGSRCCKFTFGRVITSASAALQLDHVVPMSLGSDVGQPVVDLDVADRPERDLVILELDVVLVRRARSGMPGHDRRDHVPRKGFNLARTSARISGGATSTCFIMPNAGLCRIGLSQYLRSRKLHGFSAAWVGIMIIPYQTEKNNAKVRPFRNSAVERRRGTLIPGWVWDGFRLS